MKVSNIVMTITCIMGAGFSGVAIAGGGDRLYLGIGARFENDIYETVDDEVDFLPVINAQKGGFYWEGNEIGYRLYENSNVEIGPVYSFFEGYGFDEDDLGEGYKGLRTRDGGQSYGVYIGFEAEPFSVGFKPMKHSEDGASFEFSIEHEFRRDKWLVMTSVFSEYLDKDYTNYYFCVSQSEVSNPLNTRINNTYKAGSATNFGAEIGLFYQVSTKWLLSAMVEYTSLDKAITDSPLVEDDYTYSFSAGISYRF